MNLKNSNGRAVNYQHRLLIFFKITGLCLANLHSGRFQDLNIFTDYVKTIIAREAMTDLARRTSAILKVHKIFMNLPSAGLTGLVYARTKHLWRRQELNTENEMVQILFFSNNSLFDFHDFILIWSMSSKRSAGPLVLSILQNVGFVLYQRRTRKLVLFE